jgi:hypothetical protein
MRPNENTGDGEIEHVQEGLYPTIIHMTYLPRDISNRGTYHKPAHRYGFFTESREEMFWMHLDHMKADSQKK